MKGWQNSPGKGWQNSLGFFEVLKQAQYLNFNNCFLCDQDPLNVIEERLVR